MCAGIGIRNRCKGKMGPLTLSDCFTKSAYGMGLIGFSAFFFYFYFLIFFIIVIITMMMVFFSLPPLSLTCFVFSICLSWGNCSRFSHHKVKDVSASWDIDEITVAIDCLVTCCVETQVSLRVAAVLDEDLCYKVHLNHWVVFLGVEITCCRAVKLLSFLIL